MPLWPALIASREYSTKAQNLSGEHQEVEVQGVRNTYVFKVLFVKLWREQEKPTRTKRKGRLFNKPYKNASAQSYIKT